MLRVGLHENISILFLLAIKTAGSAQKLRVGRVSGNTAIFCLRLKIKGEEEEEINGLIIDGLDGLSNQRFDTNVLVWVVYLILACRHFI